MDANEMEAHVASSLAQAIFEHAARISRTASMTELIRLNADFAHQLPGADRCSLWLVDRLTSRAMSCGRFLPMELNRFASRSARGWLVPACCNSRRFWSMIHNQTRVFSARSMLAAAM